MKKYKRTQPVCVQLKKSKKKKTKKKQEETLFSELT